MRLVRCKLWRREDDDWNDEDEEGGDGDEDNEILRLAQGNVIVLEG